MSGSPSGSESDRGQSTNSRMHSPQRSYVPTTPREMIDATAPTVTKDLIHPPGVEQIISSGDEGSFTEGATNEYEENESNGDDGTDGLSHSTGMRTRVMRWLGQAIDENEEDETCNQNGTGEKANANGYY